MLPVILRLDKLELVLNAVARLRDGKFELLARLVWNLRIRQSTQS